MITLARHGYHSVFGAVLRQGALQANLERFNFATAACSRYQLPYCGTGTGPQNSGDPTGV